MALRSGIAGTAVLEEESLTTWAFARERDGDEEVRRRFGSGARSGGGASDPAAIRTSMVWKPAGRFQSSKQSTRPTALVAR